MNKNRLNAYIELLMVAVIWGAATPVIKFTMQGIGPVSFLAYRFYLASLLAVLIIFVIRSGLQGIKDNFVRVIIYSLFSTTFALGLLFLGLERTTVLDTVLITAISPLVTAIFGVFFLKEVITRQEKLGITLAFIGTMVTIMEPIFTGNSHIRQVSGNFLVFGYLLTNSYAAIEAKRLAQKGVNSFVLSNISFLIGFITIIPVALYLAPLPEMIEVVTTMELKYHLGVSYMAFVSGTLAYALWIKGQRYIEVSEAGVFAYLTPIFAAPLAVLWLGENITTPFIIGAVIIAIGVFIAETRRQEVES